MDVKQINKKLAELEAIRAALVGELRQTDGIEALEQAQPMIKPGSREHETLLAIGYGMDKAKAERIIAERAERPDVWPYEEMEKAQAFLAALAAKPEVVSDRSPWRTTRHARATTTGR